VCRKSINPTSFALVLCLILASMVQADLIGWWTFDEGSGTTAYDSSGNGHDGTLLGTGEWGPGPFGAAALEFGTDKCTGINCGVFDPTGGTPEFTLALWAYWDGTPGFSYHFLTKSNGWAADTMMFQVELWADDSREGYTERVGISYQGNSTASVPFGVMPKNEWVHLAWTFDGTNATVYMNGIDDEGPKPFSIGPNVDAPVIIGASTLGATRVFEGFLDDMRLFDYALTEAEVRAVMVGTEQSQTAYGPEPADSALLTGTWANLSWRAGPSAVSHDVYVGDSLDAVSEATRDSDVFQGNLTVTTLLVGFPGYAYPDGLEPGTTYYWRIDEVNDADPNSPWKGNVWSFSIAPRTAYNPNPADGAEFVGPDNMTLTWTLGFGAKLHTIYFGEDYDEVNNAVAGTISGTTSYRPGALEREKVYYWRVDEYDGIETYKGDVWTFTTPGAVGNPQPANGATDVAMTTALNWTPADNAASHQLYFGADKDTVRTADTSAPQYKGSIALGAESYDPGLLEANTAYYWRVDEVDDQGNVSTGPLWIFTTGAYLLVDDFESYTDDDTAGQAIWQTWIDGFGIADNGAQVGYLMPPYAEQSIVHGGSQSMPLQYVNEAGVTNSEASMTLTTRRDWTLTGVAELSLWFRGATGNAAEPLYVAISNSAGAPAVVANDDPSAGTTLSWTKWAVPLQAFADKGINLTNVNTITIGLGTKSNVAAPGGSGTIYIDDIRLNQ
jgi:hypothetical protein